MLGDETFNITTIATIATINTTTVLKTFQHIKTVYRVKWYNKSIASNASDNVDGWVSVVALNRKMPYQAIYAPSVSVSAYRVAAI